MSPASLSTGVRSWRPDSTRSLVDLRDHQGCLPGNRDPYGSVVARVDRGDAHRCVVHQRRLQPVDPAGRVAIMSNENHAPLARARRDRFWNHEVDLYLCLAAVDYGGRHPAPGLAGSRKSRRFESGFQGCLRRKLRWVDHNVSVARERRHRKGRSFGAEVHRLRSDDDERSLAG